jgi:hypothetical protein
MFDSMGFEPWLLVDDNENNKDASIHTNIRMTDFKTYAKHPFPIVSYIEVAMSCDPDIRRIFRSMGAKTAKTYLGNILNIDIETITFYQGINFSHHVAGELDEIFVSPHYDIHAEYAGSINGLCGKTRIAPYVWDPMFIENLGSGYNGANLTETSPRTFLIVEPNIGFQKNALIPILIAEAYFRKYPDLVENVVVINGQKFKENSYFSTSILPCLTIYTSGKLQLLGRADMNNIVQTFHTAIVLQHQINNSYNYSFMEWLTLGYPLVHNIERFKEYGYYYNANNFDEAVTQVESIVKYHETNKQTYKAQTEHLTWRFSIYNPENMELWRQLALERS